MMQNSIINWESYNSTGVNGKYLFKFLSEENLLRFLKTTGMALSPLKEALLYPVWGELILLISQLMM